MKWQKIAIFMIIYGVICFFIANFIGVNTTNSEPKGYYLYFNDNNYKIGDYVLICVSDTRHANIIKKLMFKYDFGNCPNDMPYLLKTIVAKDGDWVNITPYGVWINDKLHYNSVVLQNYRGVDLLPQPYGRFRLGQDEFFVLGNSVNSYDSRYFGVVYKHQVKFQALYLMPLLFNY